MSYMLHRIIQPMTPSSLLRKLGHNSNLILHNTRDCRRIKLNQIVELTEHKGKIIMIHDKTSSNSYKHHYITDDTLVSILNAQHKVTPFTFWLRPRPAINYYIFPTPQFLPKLFDQLELLYGQNSIEYADTEGFVTCGKFNDWQTLDFHTYRMHNNDITIQFGIGAVEEPYPVYEPIPEYPFHHQSVA